MRAVWLVLGLLVANSTASIPRISPHFPANAHSPSLSQRASGFCAGNTPDTREQWCDFDIHTDYTTTAPDTGVVREFWLELDQAILAPDGRPRWTLAINGTIPGPTLEANWGDTVVVHLRNNLPDTVQNGTSLHFHGIRQHYSNGMDGVVAVTQCPLAPNTTMTYRWRATQYGTTWYHSHIGLQTWEGAFGGIIIHGPASANYDEDKGVILMNDWDLHTVDELWDTAQLVGAPTMDNALINGMNVFGADGAGDQTGRRFNMSFEAGKSYRLRIGNAACDTHFKFSIDHHTLTVIANDLVPIRPYTTTVLDVAIGQRYDVIVQADQAATADAFWLRAVPQISCSKSSNADDVRGIIYYDEAAALPATAAHNASNSCSDEDASKLVPIVSPALHLTPNDTYYIETLSATAAKNENSLYRWQLNGTSMHLNWSEPTLRQIHHGNPAASLPASHAALAIPRRDSWVLVVVETSLNAPHPVHLHGHDFLVVAQGVGSYSVPSQGIHFAPNTLPKRDTAMLPAQGYLALAFRSDNPGAWLLHCHIGWHLEQGFALQIVEREAEMGELATGWTGAHETNCGQWQRYWEQCVILEEGSGV